MSFQADAGRQGRTFEDVVVDTLSRVGWHIIERRWREPSTLVEIDVIAADARGETWWIECKGSWLSASGRNGCTRTDTVKKLVGDAALLSTVPDRRRYLLVTSDMPSAGEAARLWLDIALAQGWLARVEILAMFGGAP